jgi:hypothetical protein
LPARCCQPAVAGGVIYADLLGELNTHLAPQAVLLRFLLCVSLCYKLSPFQALGKVTLHVFSGLRVYLPFTWEVGLPPSPVEFSSHRHFHKLSCSWLLGVCHCSCLLQLVCCEGFPFLPPLVLRAPCPLCYVSFLLLLFIIWVFFLFSLGGGWSVQGSVLIWPRVFCGSTPCCLAHLVVRVFPSGLGAAVWW